MTKFQIETGTLPSTGALFGARFVTTCRICLLSAFAGMLGLILLYLLIATEIV